MATKLVPLETLVLDWNLYPRVSVDSMQVTRLVEALEAGEDLPPLLVDAGSKRVVDGFHRYYAHLRAKRAEAPIREQAFASEAEVLRAAIWSNARHGVPLGPQDQARVIVLAETVGLATVEAARALGVTKRRIENIQRRFGRVRRRPFYLKPSVRHFAGREVPREVQEIAPALGGNTAEFYARQLIMLLRSGGADLSGGLPALLEELRSEIDGVLAAQAGSSAARA